MTLTRAQWLGTVLAGLAITIAPACTPTLWAQGPDPFRPYNRQYDPYTVPMGPATPDAGQFVGGMPRSGIRGANQYQSYLEELQGGGRQGGERPGIGVPYYRSSVDPSFDTKGTREYRPNREADRSYEQSQELVTRKYMAYFTEKDPKKRAALLRDYNSTRSRVARTLSTRRENQARALDEATAVASETRRSAVATELPLRSSASDRAPRTKPADPTARGGTRGIPEPPPLLGGSGRASRPPRSPEDVLKRSRRLNSLKTVTPDREAATGRLPGSGVRPTPEAPLPE